jgi:hypothetical protein
MSDRLFVYKTPLHRITETVVVLVLAFGAAALWQETVPDISPSYIIVAALLLGFALVSRYGTLLAQRRGAPMLTRDERTRRYLGEFGPVGLQARANDFSGLGTPLPRRRTGGRNLRRS